MATMAVSTALIEEDISTGPVNHGFSPPPSPSLSTISATRAPQEEIREIQDLLAACSQGGMQVGDTYYLISHKWLSNWRQWVGAVGCPPKRPRPRKRASSSSDTGLLTPPTLSRSSSDPSTSKNGLLSTEAWPAVGLSALQPSGAPPSSLSAPTSPNLRPTTASSLLPDPASAEFCLTALEEPSARSERDQAWTKERPGPIDNAILLDEENPNAMELLLLKPGLQENFDFEVVPEAVWNKLHTWYKGGPAITRKASLQMTGDTQVEIYGIRLRVQPPGESEPATLEVPRYATVSDLESKVRQALGLRSDPSGELQLWRQPEARRQSLFAWDPLQPRTPQTCSLLEPGERPLDTFRLQMDEVILATTSDYLDTPVLPRPPRADQQKTTTANSSHNSPAYDMFAEEEDEPADSQAQPNGHGVHHPPGTSQQYLDTHSNPWSSQVGQGGNFGNNNRSLFAPGGRTGLPLVREAWSDFSGDASGRETDDDADDEWMPNANSDSNSPPPLNRREAQSRGFAASRKQVVDDLPTNTLPDSDVVVHSAGLDNLMNTCFMNSSLQCLVTIDELRDYFLSEAFRDDLELQGKVTEITKGELAEGFHRLASLMWQPSSTSIAPSRFKNLIAKFASGFDGYRQHDCMEFIEYLIDGLKEDVNRVKGKKMYVERADSDGRPDSVVALEAANKFLLRNDSLIDDMFVGFLKSSTRCPEEACQHESVVFDPFLSLKVPLQSSQRLSETTFQVKCFPAAGLISTGQLVSVSVKKTGTAELIINAAAKAAGFDPKNCFMVELYKQRIFKFFEASDLVADINEADILVLYELTCPEAFKLSRERRWGAGQAVRDGDIVQVLVDFDSNSEIRRPLARGLLGRVREVDSDGDAHIDFDGFQGGEWVFQENLGNLKVDLSIDADQQQRISSIDGQAYTLRELIEQWYTTQHIDELRDQWWPAMKPCQAPQTDARSAVFVCFRSRPPHQMLFGVPVVFDTPRHSTAEQLTEATLEKLQERFGEDLSEDLIFYKGPDVHSLRDSEQPLIEEGIRDLGYLGDREYLVTEWPFEGGDPITRALLDATPREPRVTHHDDEAVALEDCFEWLTEQEQLSEFDAVYCSKCKDHRQMFKQVNLWTVPPVLVLQLKRFAEDMRQRLSTPVKFPVENLDLTKFCMAETPSFPSTGCVRAGARVEIHGLQSASGKELNGQEGVAQYLDSASGRFCVQLNPDDPPGKWKKVKPDNLKPAADPDSEDSKVEAIYDLAGLCKHVGDARFGHYIAYVRSTVDGKWRYFDDEIVTEVSATTVASEQIGAYVLFYLRKDRRPACWESPRTT